MNMRLVTCRLRCGKTVDRKKVARATAERTAIKSCRRPERKLLTRNAAPYGFLSQSNLESRSQPWRSTCRAVISQSTQTSRIVRRSISRKATRSVACPSRKPSGVHGPQSTGKTRVARSPAVVAVANHRAIRLLIRAVAPAALPRHRGPLQHVRLQLKKLQLRASTTRRSRDTASIGIARWHGSFADMSFL